MTRETKLELCYVGLVCRRAGVVGVVLLLFAGACSGCGGLGRRTAGAGSHHARIRRTTRPSPGAARSHEVRNATPQPGWIRHLGPVPILVYHDLGSPPASEPWPGLYVLDRTFGDEMRWLYDHGYQAVTLDEVMKAWFDRGTLPGKPIVITFDNGYVPQATFAPAVLSRYGWPGVLNEITESHLATWRLKHLVAIGWEIDSHSLTHPNLTTLNPAELTQQVAASRRFLQRTLHVPVDSFCYPSNRYNARVVAAVKAAGYSNALTENPGYASRARRFQLNRFEMTGGIAQLAADLVGA